MKKRKILVLFIGLLFFATGCDSGTQTTQIQDIGDIEWQSDGSAMYGFIQSYLQSNLNPLQTTPSQAYDIAKFDANGNVIQTYTNSIKSRSNDPVTGETESYATALYLSADGSTIIAQMEGDIYRFHTATNTFDKVLNQYHLILVSPDQHYVIATNSASYQPIKELDEFDISVTPARQVFRLAYDTITILPGKWLSNGMFAVSLIDSLNSPVGTHINIYDTTGALRIRIPGAETAFHNTVYHSSTNNLFVRNRAGKTSDGFIDEINLTTLSRKTILAINTSNFDISGDEQAIIYSAKDSTHQTTNLVSLRSRNLATNAENLLATDNIRYVILSPSENKLVYIAGDINFNKPKVIPFTKP